VLTAVVGVALGAVVPGAGGDEVAAATTGGTATATVLVVDTSTPAASAAPAAKRLPTNVVEVVGGNVPALRRGRALACGWVGDASRETAARTMRIDAPPTATASRRLMRAVLVLPYHHDRSRSWAWGRPNAAFLAMNCRKG